MKITIVTIHKSIAALAIASCAISYADKMHAGVDPAHLGTYAIFAENSLVHVRQCQNQKQDLAHPTAGSEICTPRANSTDWTLSSERFRSTLLEVFLKRPGHSFDPDTQILKQAYEKLEDARERITMAEYLKLAADYASTIQTLKETIARLPADSGSNAAAVLQAEIDHIEELIKFELPRKKISAEVTDRLDHLINDVVTTGIVISLDPAAAEHRFDYDLLRNFIYVHYALKDLTWVQIQGASAGVAIEMMQTEMMQLTYFMVTGYNPSEFSKPENCDDYVMIDSVGLCPRNPVENLPTISAYAFGPYVQRAWLDFGPESLVDGIQELNPIDPDKVYAIDAGTKRVRGYYAYSLPNHAMYAGLLETRKKQVQNLPPAQWQAILNTYAWVNSDAGEKTHPIAQKAIDENNLYDLLGNVDEFAVVLTTPGPATDGASNSAPGQAYEFPHRKPTYLAMDACNFSSTECDLVPEVIRMVNANDEYLYSSTVGFRLIRTRLGDTLKK